MSHYDAAIFTARRLEMCEIVEMTLFYFLDRPQVHSPLSGLPFMVSGVNLSLHVRFNMCCAAFLLCISVSWSRCFRLILSVDKEIQGLSFT